MKTDFTAVGVAERSQLLGNQNQEMRRYWKAQIPSGCPCFLSWRPGVHAGEMSTMSFHVVLLRLHTRGPSTWLKPCCMLPQGWPPGWVWKVPLVNRCDGIACCPSPEQPYGPWGKAQHVQVRSAVFYVWHSLFVKMSVAGKGTALAGATD